MNMTNINSFMKELKSYKGQMSRQQLKSIRGQAISGNIELAIKGLESVRDEKKKRQTTD